MTDATEESGKITDGDRNERHLAMGRPEPVAAEEVDGGECAYDDCDRGADFRVQFDQQDGDESAVVLMCATCSRQNAIHVQANELLDNEITVRK